MSDKRSNERIPADIAARLISERLNVFCTVLDLSGTGARVQIEPGLFLPREFVLRARELGGDRPVEVVWAQQDADRRPFPRRGTRAGSPHKVDQRDGRAQPGGGSSPTLLCESRMSRSDRSPPVASLLIMPRPPAAVYRPRAERVGQAGRAVPNPLRPDTRPAP